MLTLQTTSAQLYFLYVQFTVFVFNHLPRIRFEGFEIEVFYNLDLNVENLMNNEHILSKLLIQEIKATFIFIFKVSKQQS